LEQVPAWSDNPEELKILQQGLLEDIQGKFGPSNRETYGWVLRGEGGGVIAGVAGFVHWNWVYVAQVWVEQDCRGQGLAKKLLQHLEAWAAGRRYQGLYIDTFEESVKLMYEKIGYVSFGSIPQFPPGHQRFFLYRNLKVKE
jgi:GNAT superfamily N-acetyltransferase